MKMPMPFRRDTAAEIKRTTGQVSQVAAKLTALQEKRAEFITDAAEIATLSSIGDEVASTERLISTLQERLVVLDGRRKEEREASLEERKAATLGELERRLRSEADAAVAVVDAFVAAANAYGRYKEIRSRPRPWSDLLTTPMACQLVSTI